MKRKDLDIRHVRVVAQDKTFKDGTTLPIVSVLVGTAAKQRDADTFVAFINTDRDVNPEYWMWTDGTGNVVLARWHIDTYVKKYDKYRTSHQAGKSQSISIPVAAIGSPKHLRVIVMFSDDKPNTQADLAPNQSKRTDADPVWSRSLGMP